MVTRLSRVAALPALLVLLSAAAGCTGPAATPSPDPSVTTSSPAMTSIPATPTPEPSDPDASPGTPVREEGYAMYCAGLRGDGTRVVVELYTNSTADVPASVAVLEPGEDGERLVISSVGTLAPTFAAGEVSADVPLTRVATGADAGTAEVRGTYEPTGDVRQVGEDFEDAGERIRTTGSNEALDVDMRVQIGEEQVGLECGEAFRFDLQVTTTPIS